MVMDDSNSGGEDSVWKSLINEVKEEKPIENEPAKQGVENQDSIENKPIEKTIEKPLEKAIEKPKKEPSKSKFTTIMITKELKDKIDSEKDPHESYGDFIKRLLEVHA